MGESRGVYMVWWGQMRNRDYVGELGVDGRIIKKWIFRKCDVREWTGSSWLRKKRVGGHL
jgi:hypothetical protein